MVQYDVARMKIPALIYFYLSIYFTHPQKTFEKLFLKLKYKNLIQAKSVLINVTLINCQEFSKGFGSWLSTCV